MQRNRRRAAVACTLLVVALAAPNASAQPTDPNKWPENPATAADPPLIPPPGTTPAAPRMPTSTSGTDVTPPSNLPPPAPIVVESEASKAAAEESRAKIRELEERAALDEARIKTLEKDLGPLRHLKFEGYVQFQYRLQSFNEAASPNKVNGALPPGITPNDVIAKSDGTTTNTNLFRLRRTRLRATYETDVARVFLQVDLLPSGGPSATEGTIARNAEASGIAHWTKDVKTVFTGGLFQVPFLEEVTEASMYRPWIERTTASLNMFPTERDLGVRVRTFFKEDLFSAELGVLNGQRLGETTFVAQPDLNASKDFFAVLTSKIGPAEMHLAGYAGRSQTVDPAQLRVKNYGRRAVSFAVTAVHPLIPSLGDTKFFSELSFGTNMDSGVTYAFAKPAIPASFTDEVIDQNERSFQIRAEQELTKWGIAGFRFDTYTTNSAVKNNAKDTWALMGGLRFTKHLRFINEGSIAIDNIHADGTSAPSKHILQFTSWMQGSFY